MATLDDVDAMYARMDINEVKERIDSFLAKAKARYDELVSSRMSLSAQSFSVTSSDTAEIYLNTVVPALSSLIAMITFIHDLSCWPLRIELEGHYGMYDAYKLQIDAAVAELAERNRIEEEAVRQRNIEGQAAADAANAELGEDDEPVSFTPEVFVPSRELIGADGPLSSINSTIDIIQVIIDDEVWQTVMP
jgi:hypothetical protein